MTDLKQMYLREARQFSGRSQINPDGSTFMVTPFSQLGQKVDELRQKLGLESSFEQQYDRDWLSIPNPQPLALTNIDRLCDRRYLMKPFAPRDLAHFPADTLGGAYVQYRFDAKFYDFDKDPLPTDSEVTWLMRLIRQTHDFYHIVSEIYHYGWDGGYLVFDDPLQDARDRLVFSEEYCVIAFRLAQSRLLETIPIIADLANAYRRVAIEPRVQDIPLIVKQYDGLCEELMYVSFKQGFLAGEISVDDYLDQLDRDLLPLSKDASEDEFLFRDMILECFEQGLRAKSLICFEWDRYLGNSLKEVREFLQIPRRKIFKAGSHYLEADLY
ncbi:MAG: Coq4 family protein [Spirulina sp.]